MRPMIGRTLKHYEVEERLGQGGMGVVYRARDTRLNRPVALKLLPPEFTEDADRRQRFLREARAACAVNHPAIAQVYDVDEADGGVFFAMELVEGKTVRALMQGRELDLLGGLEVATQVASGLAKAHEAGIVHRDIKPENIMVTPDGHAKLLDFGLAKLLEPESGAKAASGDELSHMETVARTQAGMVMGTLRYMSPEQARGQSVDHRSDVFSLGVVLYEMVTGQLPFSGNNPLDTLHSIAFEETRPVTAIRANLPPSLQRVVSRCLRKRPQDRYGEAKELVSDLKAVQREVESGISQKIPFKAQLQERLRALGERTLKEWAWSAGAGIVVLGLMAGLVASEEISLAAIFWIGVGGLFVYRRIRNRSYRFMRRFAAKIQRMPEVRIIAVDGRQVTVLADRALAKTYVRVNSVINGINAKMFFGEPFSATVRDDLTEEETRALLSGPGIVYVRPDALEP
jgi:predicted Ser/Thr protein kinase